MSYYNRDITDIYSEFESGEKGLKENQISAKIKRFGQNLIEKHKKQSLFAKLFNQFKNLMIIILIVSAVISIVMSVIQNDKESMFEGVLIFVIVIINAVVGVIQELKAENALDLLMSSTEPFAKVYRDGLLKKIRVHELVPGDVIELSTGDIIPADIRLINAENLRCNESSLTGESQPVVKNSRKITNKNVIINDQDNMCFSGTSVVAGKGKGIIVSTGKNTEIGKIAKILSKSIKEKTPLEKNIDRIGKVLTFLILAIVVIVFTVQVIFNKNQSVIDALLIAVALAVAAIPESLPTIITIIMALGVQKLARQNAIVKKLSAVETLGSCNIICSDKTGTLTKNEMAVNHIYDNLNIKNASSVILDKNSQLVKINALCNNAIIDKSSITADATETAIISFLINNKINIKEIKERNKRIFENEFDSTRKMMSVFCEDDCLYVKGALDYILKKCKFVLINNKICNISDKYRQKITNDAEKVCEYGERVIAFAYKQDYKNLNEKINISNLKGNKLIEEDLIFVGFFGIIDPPRKEAKKSVNECKKAGLKVMMITGDHPSTALAIAKELDIARSKKEVITGQEINNLSENELAKIINKYSVFARVTPEHKLKIVNALKKSGNIVAMTGDGVNDAPSIKQANIGVCMGKTGTDVTKNVADIIISDDNFSTIVLSVKQGRTIYQNIEKTILFLLSTNIVEVLGIFITSLIMPEAVFLTATQILFINLVTDSLPAFALGVEPPEKNIMDKKPRDSNKSILSGKVGSSIIYQGFIQSLIVLVMFIVSKYKFGDAIASTMSFLTICFMQIIHAINCKTEKSIFKTNIFKNQFFNFSFIVLLFLIIGVYFVPFFASLFDIVTLSSLQWIIVIATSLSIIPLVEIGKCFIKD